MRVLLRLNVLLALLLAVGSLAVFPLLPEQLPAGLDFQGAARGWRPKALVPWVGLPAIGAVVAAVLIWMTVWLIPRKPASINIPDKDRLLELPPDRQQPVVRHVQSLVLVVSAGVLLMFGGIQLGVALAALGRPSMVVMLGTLLMGLLSPLAALAVYLPRISDEIDRQRAMMGPARRSHART